MFFHEYEIAVDRLNEIWEIQEAEKNRRGLDIYENPNNIIAFCGERGSGKSSVMLSFMNAVVHAGERKDTLNFNENIRQNSWDIKIVIDPSMFDGVHNIVDIVLAHIYQGFSEAYEEDSQCIELYEREKMISLLTKTYKYLSIIKNKEKVLNDEYDTEGNIAKLEKLGEGTQLRESFEKLAEFYLKIYPKLKYKNSSRKTSQKLLIAVDDLDLCNEYAYEMAEQIRKYLILPNVIILMAIKIEQLEMGVEEKNREDFKHIIAGRKKDKALQSEMERMAERYVTKLIPNARRIYLPVLKSTEVSLEWETDLQQDYQQTIEEKVFKMIQKKTGLIIISSMKMRKIASTWGKTESVFMSPNFSKNYFVPQNLREAINLIVFLEKLKDLENDDKEKIENIRHFHSYFVEEMLKPCIDRSRLTDLTEVLESDDDSFNFNMGNYLDALLSEKGIQGNADSEIWYDFPNSSLAYVLKKLDVCSKYLAKRKDYQLFYYITIYYTILLNERMCESWDKKVSYYLTNRLIWGNQLNGIFPVLERTIILRRERFFVNTIVAWNVVSDVLQEWNGSMYMEKKDIDKNYTSAIKEENIFPETVCWVLLALLTASIVLPYPNGRYNIYRGILVYNNHAVPSEVSVSLEYYFANLCAVKEIKDIVNLSLLGISKEVAEHLLTAIEKNNELLIRQAEVISLNPDLSKKLLEYCRIKADYKAVAGKSRTYQLVKRFFGNVRDFLSEFGLNEVDDWAEFWIPTGYNEQGDIIGSKIDICNIYAKLCDVAMEEISTNLNESQKQKQFFAQQAGQMALSDYTRKIPNIPSFLKNKTAEYAKKTLENIGNGIQKYTYREKKFPEGYNSEMLINLYSEVIDLYDRNPKAELTNEQLDRYRTIAKIRDAIK